MPRSASFMVATGDKRPLRREGGNSLQWGKRKLVQCPGGLTTRTTQQHGEYRDEWLMRADSREILRASGGGAKKKKARAVKGNPQKQRMMARAATRRFFFMERNQRQRAHGSVRCRHGWRVCMRAGAEKNVRWRDAGARVRVPPKIACRCRAPLRKERPSKGAFGAGLPRILFVQVAGQGGKGNKRLIAEGDG